MGTRIAKGAHMRPPGLIAARLRRTTHPRFDLLVRQPELALTIGNGHMIGQGHLHDLTDIHLQMGRPLGHIMEPKCPVPKE
jgi:hypothetical protein